MIGDVKVISSIRMNENVSTLHISVKCQNKDTSKGPSKRKITTITIREEDRSV
jgi:hypothetical protein